MHLEFGSLQGDVYKGKPRTSLIQQADDKADSARPYEAGKERLNICGTGADA